MALSLPLRWDEAGHYLVRVKDSIQDNEGNELDGEWINPVSFTTANSNEFPSGNDKISGAVTLILYLP